MLINFNWSCDHSTCYVHIFIFLGTYTASIIIIIRYSPRTKNRNKNNLFLSYHPLEERWTDSDIHFFFVFFKDIRKWVSECIVGGGRNEKKVMGESKLKE